MQMPDRRVLVIEDDPDLAETIRIGLKSLGYTVECAITAREARRKILAGGFPVAVIDCVMPGYAGTTVATLAKDHGMGAVMMSGYPDATEVFPLNGFRFVAKPFDIDDLMKAIEEALLEARGTGSDRRPSPSQWTQPDRPRRKKSW
jgi:DNA-binding NtrC family response regulator